MIELKAMASGDEGRQVKYESYATIEYGRITSWNERFIFVRYHTKVNKATGRSVPRTGETSEATDPRHLEFV